MATVSLDLVSPFLAVAELGSFSRAAARLGVEKSSVSRAVGRLEDAFGDRLFLRTTRSVSLTEAGQSVRDLLREPHANLESALAAVLETARKPRSRIVVTAAVDFASSILADALARFARRYPHVAVEVRATGAYVDLVRDGVDAAVRLTAKRLGDSALRARKLGALKCGVFVSPSYAESHGVPRTPEEARAHPWVFFPPFREVRFQGPGGVFRVQPEGRIAGDEMTFVMSSVLHGLGLAVLPYFLADDAVRQGRLIPILTRWSIAVGDIWFITPPGRRNPPAVDGLRECIHEVLSARRLTDAD